MAHDDTIELTQIFPYPDTEEALPYVTHGSYKLDRELTPILTEKSGKEMSLAYGERAFLNLFHVIDSLPQVLHIPVGIQEDTEGKLDNLSWNNPVIPMKTFYKYIAFTNNIFQKDLTTYEDLTYYAVCRLRTKSGWLLVYGCQNGIHDNVDLYLCSYSNSRKRVVSKLHIRSDNLLKGISTYINGDEMLICHNIPFNATEENKMEVKCKFDDFRGSVLCWSDKEKNRPTIQ